MLRLASPVNSAINAALLSRVALAIGLVFSICTTAHAATLTPDPMPDEAIFTRSDKCPNLSRHPNKITIPMTRNFWPSSNRCNTCDCSSKELDLTNPSPSSPIIGI